MLRSTLLAFVLALGAIALAGCTSYYKVTDPNTGRSYYTTKMKDMKSGAAKFEDERTKTEVTIQNSQVEKITKDQYEAAIQASPTTRPT